ncbi:MAG TPA: hypothetical protein PLG05_09560 [Bacteroidales bacterium]|nr:hypothetical protein [Bacteroidales bacterium]HOR60995.1 hypothetical protein [Bacteroidales bacterium]HPL05409.1 hypothetical protein [Bacteroidales bacterium]
MKKTLLISIFCVFVSFASIAQEASGNVDFVIPTYSNADLSLGVGLLYLYDLDNGINIGGFIAYRQMLNFKGYFFDIPIMFIARYYINGGSSGLYPQVGLGVENSFSVIKYKWGGSTQKISTSGISFAYSVGLGGKLRNNLDLSGHFEGRVFDNNHRGYVVLRVGYWF